MVTKRCISHVHSCSECVCVDTLAYHSRVPQVEGVPAEALREAVGLLTNVVFVRFNRAMWCHGLPWRNTKTVSDMKPEIHDFHLFPVVLGQDWKSWQMSYPAWAQAVCPRTGSSSELPPPWFWQDLGLQRTVQWPFGSPVAYQLATNSPVWREWNKVRQKSNLLNHRFLSKPLVWAVRAS